VPLQQQYPCDLSYENMWLRKAVEQAKMRNSELAAKQEAVRARIRVLEEENSYASAALFPPTAAASTESGACRGSEEGCSRQRSAEAPRGRGSQSLMEQGVTRHEGSLSQARVAPADDDPPALKEARQHLLETSSEVERFLEAMLARRHHLRAAILQDGPHTGRHDCSQCLLQMSCH